MKKDVIAELKQFLKDNVFECKQQFFTRPPLKPKVLKKISYKTAWKTVCLAQNLKKHFVPKILVASLLTKYTKERVWDYIISKKKGWKKNVLIAGTSTKLDFLNNKHAIILEFLNKNRIYEYILLGLSNKKIKQLSVFVIPTQLKDKSINAAINFAKKHKLKVELIPVIECK